MMKSYHYQTTSFATKTTHADLCEEATKGLLKKVRLEARDDTSDTSGLLFVANRDIEAGEELFIDYGVNYDRRGYGE